MAKVVVTLEYEVSGNTQAAVETLRGRLWPKLESPPFTETHARDWGPANFEAKLKWIEIEEVP